MTLARTAAVICAVASSAGLIAAQSDDGQFSGSLDHRAIRYSTTTSKTSLQGTFIGPATPRAIFVNDSVAVGWIPRAPLLEIAALDREQGMTFS